MREGTGAVQVLERILDLGVRLSLDDFGTGYSSLGYLSRTRFSSIKIDRSFVQGASKGEPRADRDHPRGGRARADRSAWRRPRKASRPSRSISMVQELGCTKVQGYYFGRPLPVARSARAGPGRKWNDAAAA